MRTLRTIVLPGIFFLCFSCGTSRLAGDEIVRAATDVPDLFDTPAGMNWGDNKCMNPIIDPMDGSELILVQSRDGIGDYRVLGQKYGINKGELLRINCSTGAVLGIVRGR